MKCGECRMCHGLLTVAEAEFMITKEIGLHFREKGWTRRCSEWVKSNHLT